MLTFLRTYQLNIMLSLSSVCGVIAFFVYITKTLPKAQRRALLLLELSDMFLLTADRFAYYYRGKVSTLGYWMVRISNYLVFALTLVSLYGFNLYLKEIFSDENGHVIGAKRLKTINYLIVLGEVLVILSQFTGFYYTFDATNHYQRSPGFVVCYFIPLLVLALQLSIIIQYRRTLGRTILISLLLFTMVPLAASILQIFTYGLSLTNVSIVGMAVLLYVFALLDTNKTVERANQLKIEILQEEQQRMQRLFEQTATALVNAIDAKDAYTHGHSSRVAEYSKKIAQMLGKSRQECEEIYYAALLHDVGKIGIADSIINKESGLTDEEYGIIKQHPTMGMQILSSISEYPYLSIGAHYHHERYDGKGYPEGLKGDDIPEIARIIAVADAYDAMTSKRSYRDPIPQQQVREEIVKGMGSQFDPKFAQIMQHLIDLDTEYQMQQKEELSELGGKNALICGTFRSNVSKGILVTEKPIKLHLKCVPDMDAPPDSLYPTLVLFDSLDTRVHTTEKEIQKLYYFEYGEIHLDGRTICSGARKMQTETAEAALGSTSDRQVAIYDVEAVRYQDHALFQINDGVRTTKVIIALPDSTRFLYIGLTGESCHIGDMSIEKTEKPISEGFIPRIAEKISYIDGPEGDVPNVQVDGYRTAATVGIPITDGMRITFHTKSLPTARLVWHCAFLDLFFSRDRQVGGEGYREYALIRLDGEYWESESDAENRMLVNLTTDFQGWESWKASHKSGMDCTVSFRRKKNQIITVTVNAGIEIQNITTFQGLPEEVYVALTGDQCAITEIRIDRKAQHGQR